MGVGDTPRRKRGSVVPSRIKIVHNWGKQLGSDLVKINKP